MESNKKIVPITGRCQTILEWFFYLKYVDKQTWCDLFKTKGILRKRELAEKFRLHFHWYVKKYVDMPKGTTYYIGTLGKSSFSAKKPGSRYADYPEWVLIMEPTEEREAND